jgi:hypothetical protein
MARPSYILEKDNERVTVKSKDVPAYEKRGYVNLGKADEAEVPKHKLPAIETSKPATMSPQFIPKVKAQEVKKIEIPEATLMETKSTEVPEDLVCPVCAIKSKTEDNYIRLHGDKCTRALTAKKKKNK